MRPLAHIAECHAVRRGWLSRLSRYTNERSDAGAYSPRPGRQAQDSRFKKSRCCSMWRSNRGELVLLVSVHECGLYSIQRSSQLEWLREPGEASAVCHRKSAAICQHVNSADIRCAKAEGEEDSGEQDVAFGIDEMEFEAEMRRMDLQVTNFKD